MSKDLTKAESQALTDTFLKNSKKLRLADWIAIAGFCLMVLYGSTNGSETWPISPMVCNAVVALMLVAGIVMYLIYARCPRCNCMWLKRNQHQCDKCGLKIDTKQLERKK